MKKERSGTRTGTGTFTEVVGEVFVCPEVAVEYARKRGLNVYQEVSLYVVHGLLHLLGYDDLENRERKEMRKEEKRCLKLLAQKRALIKNGSHVH